MQSDSDHEIEDLMNPTDELKKKIVTLAGTMREWNEKTKEARESVRKQLKDILDFGLNQRKMEKTELRNLINEIFEYHGISESWLRKLLPKELKDTSKTRLSYLQKQEIEEELKQQASDPQQQEFEAETEYENLQVGSTTVSSPYQSQDSSLPLSLESTMEHLTGYEAKINQPYETSVLALEETSKIIQDKLNEANKRIKGLEAEVRLLSEPFDANANLPTIYEDVPLVARIDPVEKAIVSIWIENATSI